MTPFKDYHLYLGCEVIGTYNDASGSRGYLTGITNGGTECEIQFILEDGINVEEEPQFNDIKEVKLILRKLSDMTDEEAIHIAEIVIGSYDSVKWKVHKKFKVVNEIITDEFIYFDVNKKHRGFSKSLTIDENGEIEVYEDGQPGIYMNQHKVTYYLLSKGFDLFGLIESGQAIDKNKMV